MTDEPLTSNLKPDERIVFITTDASFSDAESKWEVPIHAWVHEFERAPLRKLALAVGLRLTHRLRATESTRENFDRRARLIAADNERGKRIVIEIAGQRFELPKTGADGHTHAQLAIDAKAVSQFASGQRLSYEAVLPDDDHRSFVGTVNLIASEGVSVVSDFDDTVKITEAMQLTAMLDRTFFRDFEPVPGMAELYAAWSSRGASFHFVSATPWHLYEPVDEFLTANGFPDRSVSLKSFRFTDKTLLNLFRDSTELKPKQIEPLLHAFPRRRFVLVGDTGQHDPEVYATMLERFPDRIDAIFLRNVTGESRSDRRFVELLGDFDHDRWKLFQDPREIDLPG